MSLSDITSVFSRYFVVGFFLPSYIALVALWVCASDGFVPNTLAQHKETVQLVILGGVALVAALALSGLSYPIIRVFEGYPLRRLNRLPLLRRIYRKVIASQVRAYRKLRAVRDDRSGKPDDRARAGWLLERFFPQEEEDLLPTRLGNTIRAFEQHPNVRWGLDGVTIWPRIDALLSADERELHVDAKIDLYVFINASLGASIVGVCLLVDKATNVTDPVAGWAFYAIPFVVAYALYRASVGPAAIWGDAVRASFDLHRLEMYEKLGIRDPKSFSDERQMAVRINQALLYGRPPLGDDLWRGEALAAPPGSQQSGVVGWIAKHFSEEG
jgi:hypothetical protein